MTAPQPTWSISAREFRLLVDDWDAEHVELVEEIAEIRKTDPKAAAEFAEQRRNEMITGLSARLLGMGCPEEERPELMQAIHRSFMNLYLLRHLPPKGAA